MENKEKRVYILDVSVETDFEVHATEIDNWNSYQEIHKKLPPNAEKFISLCEELDGGGLSMILSLDNFVRSFNFDNLAQGETYIFITDNY